MAAQVIARLDELMPARLDALRRQRDALLSAVARELPQWRVTEPQAGLTLTCPLQWS